MLKCRPDYLSASGAPGSRPFWAPTWDESKGEHAPHGDDVVKPMASKSKAIFLLPLVTMAATALAQSPAPAKQTEADEYTRYELLSPEKIGRAHV